MKSESLLTTRLFFLLPVLAIVTGFFYVVSESPMAFSLGAAGILLIILFSFKPVWGFYVMVLLAPVIGPFFLIGKLNFTPIDLLAHLVLAGFYIRVAFSTFFGEKPQQLVLPFFLYFFIFLLSILTSNALNEGVLTSSWYVIRLILFFYLAYFSLGVSLINNEKILKNSIICLSISGLIVAITGVVSLAGQDIANNFFRVQGIKIFGEYPFGENHNLIAEYLVITNFFLLAVKFWIKSVPIKRLINIIFFITFLITIGTFSRAGWIVSGIQILLFLMLSQKNKVKTTLICLALLCFSVPLFIRMEQLQKENYSSTENRILLSQLALKSFIDKPFFGEGTGKYTEVVGRSIRYTANYGKAIESHGIWQKIILENGAMGVIFFGLFIIALFTFLFRTLFHAGEYYDLLLPLVIASLGGLVYQFFNTSYYKGKMWIPIAITLAAAMLVKEKLYAPKKN